MKLKKMKLSFSYGQNKGWNVLMVLLWYWLLSICCNDLTGVQAFTLHTTAHNKMYSSGLINSIRSRNDIPSTLTSRISATSFMSSSPSTASSKSTSTALHALTAMQTQFITAFTANTIPALWLHFRKKQRSLTQAGLLHATLLGIGLWTFLGLPGWIMGVCYLLLGSMATKVKMMEKEKLGIAEKRGGARGPENVWGSAATAMVAAMCTYIFPQDINKWKVVFVTAFATKLADTFGSEFGKAYGKTTFLITSLKKVPRGTEGAISLEGTLAGIGGSIILAMLARVLGLIQTSRQFNIITLSAFIATTIESYIGAIFQDNIKWLNNELVNLIMTIIGASLAYLLL